MAITVQLTRWVPLNFTDRRDITRFQIVVTNDLCIFIDLPVHSLTKLTSWNSNWNPKKVLHTQKMVTCTVMEHVHSVLHLFPSCVALENKLETVNETRNREQWRHAFYDKAHCYRARRIPQRKFTIPAIVKSVVKLQRFFSAIFCEVLAQNSCGSMISQTGGGKGGNSKSWHEKLLFGQFFSPKTAWKWKKLDRGLSTNAISTAALKSSKIAHECALYFEFKKSKMFGFWWTWYSVRVHGRGWGNGPGQLKTTTRLPLCLLAELWSCGDQRDRRLDCKHKKP